MTERDRDDLTLARRRGKAVAPVDALEITGLMQAYALFTDHGRRDELVALFTLDATWDGSEIGYASASGPDEIADVVLAHYDPERPMVHLPGPPLLIRRGDDRIDAFSWCVATRLEDGACRPAIYFSYDDVLRRTPAGWLFERRHLRLRLRST